MRAFFLVSLACSLPAIDPFDLVEWEELKLKPNGNFVYAEDRLIFHPRARLTTGYDSNSPQTAESHDEGFLGIAVGGTITWLPLEDQRFQVEGIIEGGKMDRLEPGQLPALASIVWEDQGEPWLQRAEGKIRRNDSPPLVQTGRQIYRNDWEFSYDGTLSGDYLSIGGGPLITRQQFLADALDFEGPQRDSETLSGQLHLGWQRAEVSAVEATVSGGYLRYDESFTDSNGAYPNGLFMRGRGSWLIPVGERTSLQVAAGAVQWKFTDPWGGDSSRSDASVLLPEGGLTLHWDWEEDSFVESHVTQTVLTGVDANVATVIDGGIFGRLAILHTQGLDAEIGMTRVTASSGNAGQEPERRWGYRAGVGAELYYAKGWLWRLGLNYSDSRARISEPFTRTISMLQVTVAY